MLWRRRKERRLEGLFMLTQEAKQKIIEENAVHEYDTGSPEVIA